MLQKYQIIEEDLDRAIDAGIGDICTSCIFSQAILRITNKRNRSCTNGTRFVQFTFDEVYSEDFIIENLILVEMMNKFDEAMFSHKNFNVVRQQLPFEFEFDFGGENVPRKTTS